MNFDATSYMPTNIRSVDRSAAKNDEQLRAHTELSSSRTNGEQSTKEIAGRAVDQTMASEISDEFLLFQLGEGNHGALAVLFRRYASMVGSVANRILRDSAEAEDLVQEVFLFLFRKSSLFDPTRGSVRSWMVQVTYGRAIDRRRHLASRRFYVNEELDEAVLSTEQPPADSAFFENTIEGALGTGVLEKLEAELTLDQRHTLQLFFFEGYTFEEIADSTGHAIGNVRNHYYRGLERMRRLIFRK
jgi:RNA polymerase sigma-70 factor (ECF subfamily)